MADIDYFGDDDAYGASRGYGSQDAAQPGPAGQPRIGALVNWAGAMVSLGLVIGMVVWAVQLTMRDVSGVPVIRALEGPMRVAPADPGGIQAEHQGLAVNRLAEGAEAAPVPDRLVLAPPPVNLEQVALASASVSDPEPAPEAEPEVTPAAANSQTQALIDRLIASADPLSARTQARDAAPPAAVADAALPEVAEETPAFDIIPASVPGVARSFRPPERPGALAARSLATPEMASASAVGVEDLDADSLHEGTRLVQLGAFDSLDIARAEWDRLTERFPDYFAGRARVIQEASSGGSAFYRLRAHGFEDLAASRRFCAVLVEENAPCISVTVR